MTKPRGYRWVLLLAVAGATVGGALLVRMKKRERADRPEPPPEPAVAERPAPARSLTRLAVGAAIVVVLALVTVVATRPAKDHDTAVPVLLPTIDVARPSASTWTCASVSLGGSVPMGCYSDMGPTLLDADREYAVVLPPAKWREIQQDLAPFADDGIADAVRAADPSAPLITVTLPGSDWTSIIGGLSSGADDVPARARIAGLLGILLVG